VPWRAPGVLLLPPTCAFSLLRMHQAVVHPGQSRQIENRAQKFLGLVEYAKSVASAAAEAIT
jgi:hypothetical protein